MPRRFTLAGLLLWVTLAALVLAVVVPIWRDVVRTANLGNRVVSLAASADGSTFGGLMGDGKLLIWDSQGTLKATLQTRGGFEGQVALSADGRLAAVSTGQPVGVQPPRPTVEFWDIDSVKLLKATPASLRAHAAFSPDGETFALLDEHSLTLDSPTNATPPATIGVSGVAVAFSPDGRTIAVATDTKGVETYRTVTRQCLQRLGPAEDRWPWSWVDLCWSPEGRTLAGLCTFPEDGQETIQLWRDEDEEARSLALPAGDVFFSLAFLPDGRSLALVGLSGVTRNSTGSSIVMLLDATTLKLSTAKRIDDVSLVAAGAKGDTFLTAGFFHVDLRDAATLEPRRALFGAPPSFRIWPTTIGLVVWLICFGGHRARRLRRHCRTCGRQCQPADRKDTNVDCPVCRQQAEAKRLTPADATRQRRM